MGWNQLKLTHASRLLEGISPNAYFISHSSPPPTPMGKWSPLHIRNGFRRRHRKENIFAVNSIPRKAATPVRAFSKTS
jgi:imidazoleglycerol phosphate synthase glutamine amidotransferase subunit HisH